MLHGQGEREGWRRFDGRTVLCVCTSNRESYGREGGGEGGGRGGRISGELDLGCYKRELDASIACTAVVHDIISTCGCVGVSW